MVKQRFLGTIAHYGTQLIKKTLKVVHQHHPNYHADKQYLFCFWHGKQLLPVLELIHHQTKRATLVSPSRDGELLSAWLKKLGYEVIRGSSRDKNVASLKGMLRALKQGFSLGFGIDGPIGPIYKVKPGMTHMAQKTKVAIVPVGSAFSRKWIVEKAWDKFEIPKPFAKAAFYIGEPIVVDETTDLEKMNQQLEAAIHDSEQKAQGLL